MGKQFTSVSIFEHKMSKYFLLLIDSLEFNVISLAGADFI